MSRAVLVVRGKEVVSVTEVREAASGVVETEVTGDRSASGEASANVAKAARGVKIAAIAGAVTGATVRGIVIETENRW